MLKTVVQHNIFVETTIDFSGFFDEQNDQMNTVYLK